MITWDATANAIVLGARQEVAFASWIGHTAGWIISRMMARAHSNASCGSATHFSSPNSQHPCTCN